MKKNIKSSGMVSFANAKEQRKTWKMESSIEDKEESGKYL
jgi:hypothetical protein